MENKKNPKANLEKTRMRYLQVGLFFALGITLVAFEWTTFSEPTTTYDLLGEDEFDGLTIEPIPLVQLAKPEPILSKPQPRVDMTVPPVLVDELEIQEDVESDEPEEEFEDFDLGDPDLWTNGTDSYVETEPVPIAVIESLPHFSDCSEIEDRQSQMECVEQEMFRQLYDEFEVPRIITEITGKHTAYIEFVIAVDGSITNVECINADRVHPSVAKEAIRSVKASKNWIPGEQRGTKVPVKMMVPISVNIK